VSGLAKVNEIAAKFASKGVDYKVVYVTEAHPTDGWLNSVAPRPFKQVRYARSIEDRLLTARRFADQCAVSEDHVIVDSIDDTLEKAYEARPERLYVVRSGKVLWRCGPGPWEYDTAGLAKFLQTIVPS